MFAASLIVGLVLSFSSFSLSCAVISFFEISMSDAVPVPEITR